MPVIRRSLRSDHPLRQGESRFAATLSRHNAPLHACCFALAARYAPEIGDVRTPDKSEGMERRPAPPLIHACATGGLLRLRRDRRGALIGGRTPDGAPSRRSGAEGNASVTGLGPRLRAGANRALAVQQSSLRTDRSVRRAGSRRLPGIGLRSQSAGAASHPVQMTSHENAPGG